MRKLIPKRCVSPHASSPSATHNSTPAVAIFTRAPVPGKAKTRLIPRLGREGAAEFQATLISDAIRKVSRLVSSGHDVTPYIFLAGRGLFANRSARLLTPPGIPCPATARSVANFAVLAQRGPDLGARLERAFRQMLRHHAAAIVIGTDSPLVPLRVLRLALSELRICDAVLGPCPDGGYYVVGLRDTGVATLSGRLPRKAAVSSRSHAGRSRRRRLTASAGVFRRVRWGSASAFRDTLRNLLDCGLSCSILQPFPDVDRPDDLRRLARELARSPKARRLAPAAWSFIRQRRRKNR